MRSIVSVLACLVSVLACLVSRGATIVANSTDLADVNNAVAAAFTGDVVVVPAGTSYWTNHLVVTGKGIKLQGAGTNNTIIVDENAFRTNGSSGGTLIEATWQGTNGGLFELTGFQFRGGATNTAQASVSIVDIIGSNNMTNDSVWRIYGNFWNLPAGRPIRVKAWSGLVDNNWFEMQPGTVGSGCSVDGRIDSVEKGDRSWAQVPPRGTTNLVYFEHNTFTCVSGSRAMVDGFAGARYVVRHNPLIRNRSAENHGTESTQRPRSTRYMEVYGNNFVKDGVSFAGEYAVYIRGGGLLVFSNNLTGPWPGLLRSTYDLSTDGYQPWRLANGTNVWDLNYPSGPFSVGTHTGTNGAPVLLDGTKAWGTNDYWSSFSIINYDAFFTNGATVEHLAALINNSTANTITTHDSITTARRMVWNFGNTYRLWRVDKALDAMGRGAGALLVGTSDTVPPTPTTWPNQADEPVYSWANAGGITNIAVGTYPIIANRDFFSGIAMPGYTPLVDPHPLANSSPPGGVSAINPTDGQTGVNPTTVTLSWFSAGATSFDVYFGTDNPPATPLVLNTPSSTYMLSPLGYNTAYFWKVIAYNFQGTTNNQFRFQTTNGAVNPSAPFPGPSNTRRRAFSL